MRCVISDVFIWPHLFLSLFVYSDICGAYVCPSLKNKYRESHCHFISVIKTGVSVNS